MSKSGRSISVRAGRLEFVKINAAKFNFRDDSFVHDPDQGFGSLKAHPELGEEGAAPQRISLTAS